MTEQRVAQAHADYQRSNERLADTILDIAESLQTSIKDRRVQQHPDVRRLALENEKLQDDLFRINNEWNS